MAAAGCPLLGTAAGSDRSSAAGHGVLAVLDHLKIRTEFYRGKNHGKNDKLKNQNKKAKKVQIWAYGAMNIGLEKRVGKRIFSEIDAFSFGHFLVILMAFANISVNFLHIWSIF